MTERTKISEGRVSVDPVAFWLSLLGLLAPLAVPAGLILAVGAWALPDHLPPAIRVLAAVLVGIVIYGGAILLAIGAPVAWLRLRRGDESAFRFARDAVVADLALLAIAAIGAFLIGDDDLYSLLFIFGFGLPVAAIWGALFPGVYRRLRRSRFARRY